MFTARVDRVGKAEENFFLFNLLLHRQSTGIILSPNWRENYFLSNIFLKADKLAFFYLQAFEWEEQHNCFVEISCNFLQKSLMKQKLPLFLSRSTDSIFNTRSTKKLRSAEQRVGALRGFKPGGNQVNSLEFIHWVARPIQRNLVTWLQMPITMVTNYCFTDMGWLMRYAAFEFH